jgi:hypothetical protein
VSVRLVRIMVFPSRLPCFLVLVLFLCLIYLVPAELVSGAVECRVFSRDSEAFLNTRKGHGFVIAAFTASSCSHCDKSNAAFTEFSSLLLASNITKKVKFFVVDTDSKHCADISKDFSLNSLPSVILLPKGQKHLYYSGPVDASAMLAYSFKISEAPFTTHISTATLLEFAVSHDIVVVGFFRGSGDKEELADFKSASRLFQLRYNVHFALLKSPSAISNATDLNLITSSPSACIFNNLNVPLQLRDWRKTKTSCTTLSDLEGAFASWIGPNALRLIDEITSENSQFYEEAKLPMILIFFNASNDNTALLREYEVAAQNLKGLASFAWSNDADTVTKKITLGIPAHISPAIAINTWFGDKNQYVFPSSQDLNARNIQNWVQSYLSGQLKPKVAVNSSSQIEWGAVQTLTLSKFDVVYDTTVDAVVLFFSHMQLQETEIISLQFKRAAERLRSLGVNSMPLYAFDVETNPHLPSSVEFHRLPSICIIPANKKAPPFTYYNGKGKGRAFMLCSCFYFLCDTRPQFAPFCCGFNSTLQRRSLSLTTRLIWTRKVDEHTLSSWHNCARSRQSGVNKICNHIFGFQNALSEALHP